MYTTSNISTNSTCTLTLHCMRTSYQVQYYVHKYDVHIEVVLFVYVITCNIIKPELVCTITEICWRQQAAASGFEYNSPQHHHCAFIC